MTMIHWCGTGLSSGPGLRRLIDAGHTVTVWAIEPDQARAALAGRRARIAPYSAEALDSTLRPGEIVVSMLPPDLHVGLARIALRHRAHFACSSFLSAELMALDAQARRAGSVLIAEAGLDPGVGHLMAHDLVGELIDSGLAGTDTEISFRSYCGGIPTEANPLRYKFSWSPIGVLKALKSPSHAIRDFREVTLEHPWEAVTLYDAPLPHPETFEVYPSRDCLPLLQDYGFAPDWRIRTFERGILRLRGWAEAWQPVFALLSDTSEGAEQRLARLAERLWRENEYAPGETDRVVVTVSLSAIHSGKTVFDRSWALDATGDSRGSAMARLVSGMIALAVESLLAGEFAPGLRSVPASTASARRWLAALAREAQCLTKTDHLA